MIVCHVFSFFLSPAKIRNILWRFGVCVCKSNSWTFFFPLLGHTVKDGNSLFLFRSKFSNEKFVHPEGWSWQSLIFRLLFCIFVFFLFWKTGHCPPFFACYQVPPSSPHTHGHHWLSHSTCRNFPDCPFSVVVRELPGALRPNRKKKVVGTVFFIRFFVCAFACDPRIFYSTDATVETGGERCERKWLCVFGNGLQKL
jgi:hypothetical protein